MAIMALITAHAEREIRAFVMWRKRSFGSVATSSASFAIVYRAIVRA